MPLDRDTLDALTRDLEGKQFSGWILVGRRENGGIDLRWSGDQPPAVTLPGLDSGSFTAMTDGIANSNTMQSSSDTEPEAHLTETAIKDSPALPQAVQKPDHAVFRLHDKDFDRQGHKAIIVDQPDNLPENGSIFISFSVNNAQPPQGLFSSDSHGFGDGGHVSIWIAGGRLHVRLQDTIREYLIQSRPMLKNDMTHSMLLSFGDKGMSLWVDGEAIDTRDYKGGLKGNPNPFVLGALSWSSTPGSAEPMEHFMAGTIHDFVLLDVQLTPRDMPEWLAYA